ncbi:MAG: hypothetical protein QOJ72_2091 [Nocardioidaceae bacterium]|nr:hypothetical protein [Nocardioidaceae bacterium]
MTTPQRPGGVARRLLLIAAAVVWAESIVFGVLVVLDVADLSGDRLGFGIGSGVLLTIYGAGQAWAVWRVTLGDAWARSPVVVTQLIQLLLAWNLRNSDSKWVGVLMGVAAVIALVCLLAPPVTRALGRSNAV